MEERSRKALAEQCGPLAATLAESFLTALVLRCDFHYELAMSNGATEEDIPQIITDAIESASVITKKFLDDVGDIKRAIKFGKGELT